MIRNMLKGALAFFAIGIVVGLIMPPIASGLLAAGLVSQATAATLTVATPLWNGAIFGMFGLLVPPFQKVCDMVLGNPEALAQAQHNKESEYLKSRVRELEGREQRIEEALRRPPTTVQQILTNGPATQQSFAEAEEAREAAPKSAGPTIH